MIHIEDEFELSKEKPSEDLLKKLTVEDKLIHSIFKKWPTDAELLSRIDKPKIVFESKDLKLLKDQVEDVLGSLTGRERFVIESRFGLEDGESRTLKEVGQLLKPPRSEGTVRRIEKRALEKLHKSPKRMKLSSFL